MATYQLADAGSDIDTKLGYINQDVKITSTPTFAGLSLTGNLNVGAYYAGRDSDNNFDFSTDNIIGIKINNNEIGTFNAYGLGIGEASTANYIINARYDQNGVTCIRAYNDNSSATAASYCVSETSSNLGVLASLSAGWTTSNMKVADSVCLYSENASAGLRIFTLDSNSLYLGTNNTVGMTMDTSQNCTFVSGFGINNVTAQAQKAHIVDADGTLADITTKFNSLLAYLESYGFIATS
jgi:hypothetical protein